MVVRKFEIELDVPDDFDEVYSTPYQFGRRCVIRDGMLVFNVYADAKEPEPQWRQATASDEGKQARFRDTTVCGWTHGKLLHFGRCPSADLPYLGLITAEDGSLFPEWFAQCEVPSE